MKGVLKTIGALVLATNTYAAANAQGTLQDKIGPYLDNAGRVKQEYLVKHYLWYFKGRASYNKQYSIGGHKLYEQHTIIPLIIMDLGSGRGQQFIHNYPCWYRLDDEEWVDDEADGINGNEVRKDWEQSSIQKRKEVRG